MGEMLSQETHKLVAFFPRVLFLNSYYTKCFNISKKRLNKILLCPSNFLLYVTHIFSLFFFFWLKPIFSHLLRIQIKTVQLATIHLRQLIDIVDVFQVAATQCMIFYFYLYKMRECAIFSATNIHCNSIVLIMIIL